MEKKIVTDKEAAKAMNTLIDYCTHVRCKTEEKEAR